MHHTRISLDQPGSAQLQAMQRNYNINTSKRRNKVSRFKLRDILPWRLKKFFLSGTRL